MMWWISLASFLLLGGYLTIMALRHSVPNMVSDTFYQLGKHGWLFTLVILAVAFMMLMCLIDLEKGIQCLAFIGCAGLAFVGVAPNYSDKDEYRVHKAGAITAAIGCIGWCLSVSPWITVIITVLYLLYLGNIKMLQGFKGIWYLRGSISKAHPWYWAEVAGFTDVFITYWYNY